MCRTTISTSRAALIHYLYQNNDLTKNVVFVVFEKLSSTKCQVYKNCEKKLDIMVLKWLNLLKSVKCTSIFKHKWFYVPVSFLLSLYHILTVPPLWKVFHTENLLK